MVSLAMLLGIRAPSAGLGEGDIAAVVKERKPAVRRICFEALASEQTDAVRARITARIRIDARGIVISSTAMGAEEMPTLAPCVARELGRWRFPFSDDETLVQIPFVFVEAAKTKRDP